MFLCSFQMNMREVEELLNRWLFKITPTVVELPLLTECLLYP